MSLRCSLGFHLDEWKYISETSCTRLIGKPTEIGAMTLRAFPEDQSRQCMKKEFGHDCFNSLTASLRDCLGWGRRQTRPTLHSPVAGS